MKQQEEQEKLSGIRQVLHIIGNVVGIALIAILLPLMCVNLTLIIKSYVHKDQVPTVFGVAPLIVESGSMHPTIEVNDLIFCKKVDTSTIKERDIITFQPTSATTVVTHRVIEVIQEEGEMRKFITKGDDNNVQDQDPVYSGNVVGLYFYRIPQGGRVASFLQQPIGMIICVAVPLALFLLYDMTRRLLYNRKHRQEKNEEQSELERLRALAAAIEAGEVPMAAQAAAPAPRSEYPPVEGEELPKAKLQAPEDDDLDDADET